MSMHSVLAEVMHQNLGVLQLDEFQDVAHSQYRLLHALTCPTTPTPTPGPTPAPAATRQRVTIVGDGDQAIYDWRGADVLLFEVCCTLFSEFSVFPQTLARFPTNGLNEGDTYKSAQVFFMV